MAASLAGISRPRGGGQQRHVQLLAQRSEEQRRKEQRSGQRVTREPRGEERSAVGGPAAGMARGKRTRTSSAARSTDALSVHSEGGVVHMDT